MHNPIPIKQIVRENVKTYDIKLNKLLAKRNLNNPDYFTDRALQIWISISLQSHHINHEKSRSNIKRNFIQIAIDFRYFIKILKQMATKYAGLLNQYEFKYFKYQTVFSVTFDKQDEDQ